MTAYEYFVSQSVSVPSSFKMHSLMVVRLKENNEKLIFRLKRILKRLCYYKT